MRARRRRSAYMDRTRLLAGTSRSAGFHIVDEARLAEPGRHQHAQRALCTGVCGLQRLGVAHLEVVDLEARGFERGLALGYRRGRVLALGRRLGNPVMTRWSSGAFLRSSADRYALRELMARPSASRTVAMPTISSGRSRSRTICLHHAELLVVLLAEHGDVGADLREQLGSTRSPRRRRNAGGSRSPGPRRRRRARSRVAKPVGVHHRCGRATTPGRSRRSASLARSPASSRG